VQLALLITYSSALQKLDFYGNGLGEAGLAPILEALPRASTLKELSSNLKRISRQFARNAILPAVH